LSLSTLAEHPRELPGHLFGRLGSLAHPAVATMIGMPARTRTSLLRRAGLVSRPPAQKGSGLFAMNAGCVSAIAPPPRATWRRFGLAFTWRVPPFLPTGPAS
jgi:hypothetical protein